MHFLQLWSYGDFMDIMWGVSGDVCITHVMDVTWTYYFTLNGYYVIAGFFLFIFLLEIQKTAVCTHFSHHEEKTLIDWTLREKMSFVSCRPAVNKWRLRLLLCCHWLQRYIEIYWTPQRGIDHCRIKACWVITTAPPLPPPPPLPPLYHKHKHLT